MQALDFAQFVRDQGESVFGSPTQFFVDTQLKFNSVLAGLVRGRDFKKMVKGGTLIQGHVIHDVGADTLENYSVNKAGQAKYVDIGATVQYPWREMRDGSMAWFEQVISKNVPSGLDAEHRTFQFKSMLDEATIAFVKRLRNGYERRLLAQAHLAEMDTTIDKGRDGKTLPLNVINNEMPNGLPTTNMDVEGGTWTKVGNLTVSTDPMWVPTQGFYKGVQPNTPGNLKITLGEAFRLSGFDTVARDISGWAPNLFEPFEGETVADQSFPFILTSNLGIKVIELMCDAYKADPWINKADPFMRYVFRNVPFVYAPILDGLKIWPTGSASANPIVGTEDDETNVANFGAGPRFMGFDNQSTCIFWQEDWLNKFYEPKGHPDLPTAMVRWLFTTWNLACMSRARNFTVAPAKNTVVTA